MPSNEYVGLTRLSKSLAPRRGLGRLLLGLLCGWTAGIGTAGADADPSPEELIAREKVRAAIETAMEEYLRPAGSGDERIDNAIRAIELLEQIGPDAVSYLTNELAQEDPRTFDFCALALGRLKTPESEAALREAVARAEEEIGDWPRVRKAWAAWALSVQGKADAVVLLTEGVHQSATYALHRGMSALEAVALQAAPESVPLLLELLKQLTDDPERWKERRVALKALRRAGAVAAAPKVIPFLRHGHVITRREAANTLGALRAAEATAPLIETLDDAEVTVRRSAALALEQIQPADRRRDVLVKLETETDSIVRGALYRLLARLGGANAFEALALHRKRPDPGDRRYLVQAVGMLDDPRRATLLSEALADPDTGVALQAISSLGSIGGQQAVDAFIGLLPSCKLNLAQVISAHLTRLADPRAAPAIAERLLEELSGAVTDQRAFVPLQKMAEALIHLGHSEALPRLRESREWQTDPLVIGPLDRAVALLEAVRQRGADRSRWIDTLDDSDQELRELAYARVGQLGDEKAVGALVSAFDRASVEDRVEILRVLGGLPLPPTIELLRRVLLEPEFDAVVQWPVRDMAAWSARRIGGDRMYEALAAAVDRRKGRDVRLLIYAAVLGQRRALPLLQDLRRTRMQFPGSTRAQELDKLDWITGQLAAGHSIQDVDLPPRQLTFR